MESGAHARILCVDDEPHVLDGLRRVVRGSYEITTAVGAAEGVAALAESKDFAVILSDLRMPGMDGITFLEHARTAAPDASRMLLTGNADLRSAMEAVNRGAIFRFLLKPCASDALLMALGAAVEQNRLVTAERVLLEQTLHGSVKALTDVLALINPAGFGRAARAKATAGAIAEALGSEDRWQIEVAAMLSQIGTVSLAPDTVEKLYSGSSLTHAESVAVRRLPAIASEVLASIPRLEGVREILEHQNFRFDGSGRPGGKPAGEEIPWGSRLLKVVLDFDVLESQGLTPKMAVDALRNREGHYDPALIDALADHCGFGEGHQKVVAIEIAQARSGMIFVEDVRTTTGLLLVARGQEVTERLAERLHNFLHLVDTKQKVHVVIPIPAAERAEIADAVPGAA